MPATAQRIEAVRHHCAQGWSRGTATGRRPYAELVVEFEVTEPGPAHVCGIHYTTDLWNTRQTAYAECVRLERHPETGGVEKWAAHVSLTAHVESFEYVVFCLDHAGEDAVKEIYNSNGGRLYRATPTTQTAPSTAPGPTYARATAPVARATLLGHGAAVRVLISADTREHAVPAALAEGLIAAPPQMSHDAIAPFTRILMMRNFATNTWRFTANQRVSLPGCIIASPSEPGDPETDQSYVNSWVRDSALCLREAARADLPWSKTDLLDDYVAFSRRTQQNAASQNRPGHACFFIDGQVRPWSIQNDGPALRVSAVLDCYDKLSDAGRADARTLLNDDLNHLLTAYQHPTTNLWEEADGFHFFTRAVQKRCFEQAADRHAELALTASVESLRGAAQTLAQRLEDHWFTDNDRRVSYYRATVGGGGRGGNVDSSTLMGAVYGELKASEPRLLATASVIWDSFRTLYNINHYDSPRGIGPLIGRYPEDEYDGDVAELPNVGHPWPLCTAVFAEYYYRLAAQLVQDGQVVVDETTRRFFAQLDVTLTPGSYGANTPEFAAVLEKVRTAGDRMLDAVIFHSDHLELSEQYDRHTGTQKSVRNLTWSYAAYLGAVAARPTATG